ncbi:hypothetical protein H0H93_009811, partial [Arthromyces matolae]
RSLKSATPWAQLTWALITELEKEENYKVFIGKKDKKENTSGDSKAKVAKRIGMAILPEYAALDPTAIRDRVKAKIES